ncbi:MULTISPECIES: hypothetical protein [Colwellia]|uniref:Lipoprotein n=1 Tax=Colwellia marinimaniae TaxID=1513592 RepID=A0ABQ0MXU0_9GAMM|nr:MULTISPECIES: hypothetical protein [Colwellia]GAW97197.1 hypothetical protein MTCD1_02823 [Colwellia marinimaniae]
MKSYLLIFTLITSACLVLLSACGGGDGGSSTPADGGYVEPPVSSTFPTQVALPSMTVVNDNGSLLLAASGLSLYTFDNDAMNVSSCNGAVDDTTSCAGRWPPLLVTNGAIASGNFSFITRADNAQQWAYNQQALYTYALDSAQGDVLGDGIDNIWHLARPMPIKTAMINELASYVGNQTVLSVSENNAVLTPLRTNKNGFTLYTFDMDMVNTTSCTGSCINAWPPLLADTGAQAQLPLSLINVTAGMMQWAYKGKPLYFYMGDEVAGDNKGDEVNDVWHTATLEPAIQRTDVNGRYLSATGLVNVLLADEGSNTEFSVVKQSMDGFSLYTFAMDSANSSSCSGDCLVNWPAFVPSAADATIGDFSIFTRADGTKQWAHKGMALYFFAGDTAKTDINGDNVNGVWHLIAPSTTTNFVEETTALGASITIMGMVHVMLRDVDTMDFVDLLMDKSGFALYTFDTDSAGVSNCFDACLDAWPALLADDGDQATAPYSIITRSNGMKQWAINDMALYFFSPDTTAADLLGENVDLTWHIARPAPVKVDNHATKGDLFAAHGNVLASQGKTSAQLMGLTLYTFDSDTANSGLSTCFDSCAMIWPPLYASSTEQAFGKFTIISRAENSGTTYQWLYKGLPLYFYIGDSLVGDTNGDYPLWTIARP